MSPPQGNLCIKFATFATKSSISRRPDARFFRLALEGQRLDPARCIMVGNDPVCDIAGARAVGLATLYVCSNLSPAGPPPRATYLLPEMDIPRMAALLCGEA